MLNNSPERHNSIAIYCHDVVIVLLWYHGDVIKWKHFPRYWPFVRGIHRSQVVNSPHKGQPRGALMFSLIFAWTNGWEDTRDAEDLRHHRTHYDVTVMIIHCLISFIDVLQLMLYSVSQSMMMICARFMLCYGLLWSVVWQFCSFTATGTKPCDRRMLCQWSNPKLGLYWQTDHI